MLIEKLRKEHPQHWKNATAIRVLTLDAVAAANSGHSGMPMGMADVATVLFFNHLKFDPKTPLEETADALYRAVHQGKALYIGISSYSSKQTIKMYKLLKDRNNMLNTSTILFNDQ